MFRTQRVTLVEVNPVFAHQLRLALPGTYQILNFTGTLDFGTNAFFVIGTETVGWRTRLLQLTKAGEKLVVVFASPEPAWEKAVLAIGGCVLRPGDDEKIIRVTLQQGKFVAPEISG